jgi:hypothetical protein
MSPAIVILETTLQIIHKGHEECLSFSKNKVTAERGTPLWIREVKSYRGNKNIIARFI